MPYNFPVRYDVGYGHSRDGTRTRKATLIFPALPAECESAAFTNFATRLTNTNKPHLQFCRRGLCYRAGG